MAIRSVSEHELNSTISSSFKKLGIDHPTVYQEDAVRNFLNGNDVLVCLPTGEGKSFCFACIPIVFDALRGLKKKSIAIVVSPLRALIKDQVEKFNSIGLNAAFVGVEKMCEDSLHSIKNGECQLVYSTPESLVNKVQWRELLRSDIYKKYLVAVVVDEAHCIEQW